MVAIEVWRCIIMLRDCVEWNKWTKFNTVMTCYLILMTWGAILVEHSCYNYVKHLASYYRNVYRKDLLKCPFPIDQQYLIPSIFSWNRKHRQGKTDWIFSAGEEGGISYIFGECTVWSSECFLWSVRLWVHEIHLLGQLKNIQEGLRWLQCIHCNVTWNIIGIKTRQKEENITYLPGCVAL